MLTGDKNLKDSPASNLDITVKDTSFQISYTKTNKLITALYMVTDIIDKGEPLRNKLRTLGAGIISDMYLIQQNHAGHIASSDACSKISEIMSFLDIASAINIISEMNCNILRKEFSELDQSIKGSIGNIKTLNRQINLSEFFGESARPPEWSRTGGELSTKGQYQSIGHHRSTRIGVQKGSTLLKALSDKTHFLSNSDSTNISRNGFDILKKQRRDDIINIIKTIGGSATIKDIKDKVQAMPPARAGGEQTSSLVSCGEKTLQREMVSMVKDGVLNRTGEKRWSRYFLV